MTRSMGFAAVFTAVVSAASMVGYAHFKLAGRADADALTPIGAAAVI